MEPNILVLDEPSANLDARARRQLIDILKQFHHTILLATHDTDMALELCPRSIVLYSGKIAADAPTAALALGEDSPARNLFRTPAAPALTPTPN